MRWWWWLCSWWNRTEEDQGRPRRSEEGRGGGRKGGKLCRDLSCVRFSAFLPLLFVLEASEISALSNKGSNRFTQIAFRCISESNSGLQFFIHCHIKQRGIFLQNTMQQAGKKLIKARLRDGVRTRCTEGRGQVSSRPAKWPQLSCSVLHALCVCIRVYVYILYYIKLYYIILY